MKQKLQCDKFLLHLEKVSAVDLSVIEAERKRRKELFHKVVYQSESLKDIEDVSTEDLINMLDEMDYHLGGELKFFRILSDRCTAVSKLVSIKRQRVL